MVMIRRRFLSLSWPRIFVICNASGDSNRSRWLLIAAPFRVVVKTTIAGSGAVSKSGDQVDQVAQRAGCGFAAGVGFG
jgi:hypothetical protein